MKYFRGMVVAAAVLGMAETGWAEEVPSAKPKAIQDRSIRISAGMVPGIDESELLAKNYPVEPDSGRQFSVLYQGRTWAAEHPSFAGIWGAGLFYSSADGMAYDGPLVADSEYNVSAFGLQIQGGIAFRVFKVLVLEGQPYLRFGGSNVEVSGLPDEAAVYAAFGVKAGVFLELGKRVELGVEGGYQMDASDIDIAFGGDYSQFQLTANGLQAGIVLAVHF
jgi:hypothetical protein